MRKTFFFYLLFMSLVIFSSATVHAGMIRMKTKEENGKLLFSANGKDFVDPASTNALFILNNRTYEKIQPIVVNGYPYVSIRDVFDLIGGKVEWRTDNTVLVVYEGAVYTFRPNESCITKNNVPITNSLPVQMRNGKMMIPARFFSDQLHFDLKYDSPTIQYGGILRFMPVVFLQDNQKEMAAVVRYFPFTKDQIVPFSALKLQKDATFINNNFPERIPPNIFYETYVNQTKNLTGKARLFASHVNVTNENIRYIIRLENTGSKEARIQYYKDAGQSKNTLYLQEMEKIQLIRFYNVVKQGKPEVLSLKVGERTDFVVDDIINNEFFSFLMDMNIDGTIAITSFIVPTKDQKPSNAYATPTIFYDYDYVPKTYATSPIPLGERSYLTYSGVGEGYQIFANGAIKASQLTGNALGFETGTVETNLNQQNGLKEIIELLLPQPRGTNNEITKAKWVMDLPYVEAHGAWLKDKPRNYGNLGNWNAEYYITTQLVNDTSQQKTFQLYLLNNYYGCLGVQWNGTMDAKVLDNELYFDQFQRNATKTSATITIPPEMRLWRAVEVTVPPNSQKDVTYMYILGTNSASSTYHIWTAK